MAPSPKYNHDTFPYQSIPQIKLTNPDTILQFVKQQQIYHGFPWMEYHETFHFLSRQVYNFFRLLNNDIHPNDWITPPTSTPTNHPRIWTFSTSDLERHIYIMETLAMIGTLTYWEQAHEDSSTRPPPGRL